MGCLLVRVPQRDVRVPFFVLRGRPTRGRLSFREGAQRCAWLCRWLFPGRSGAVPRSVRRCSR